MQRAATTVDPIHPRDPGLAKLFGLGRANTASGVHVDEHRVLGYPAVFRALNLLSNVHFRVRPHIYERENGGKRRATDHPSYRVVTRRANRHMSASQLRSTLHWWALAWGNGIAAIDRNRNGDVDQIVPLLPDRTHVVRARGGQIQVDSGKDDPPGDLLYATLVGGQWRTMLPENVLHIRGLSYNGIVGVPVVEVLAESLGLGMAVREFGARFFGQGAVPSGIVEIPGHLDEEQAEVFQQSLKEAHQGLGRSHMVMLLEDGVKFHQTTIPPEHAQFLQTREFELREIANIFGIQSHKLGDVNKNSYASLEQSNQEHLDDDLDPWLGRFEEELEAKLLAETEKEADTHFVEFNRNMLVRTNAEHRTSMYAAGRQWGWLSANDIRGLENMNPIGEEGDVYLSPVNMVPADQLGVENQTVEQAAELKEDWLQRYARRLEKQAVAKARKGELAGWLDKLPPVDCPMSILVEATDLQRNLVEAIRHTDEPEEIPAAVATCLRF